jgi:hypothetical protein
MMNRLRTVLVSVTAVAVATMVLGSNARAKSVPTASQQKYLRLLERLAEREMENGTSLMQRLSSLESTLKRLENIPDPGPRLARRIATQEKTVYNKELMVFSEIQKNTNALLATQADLQALPPKEQKLVSSLLKSIQAQVASEKGVATPTR